MLFQYLLHMFKSFWAWLFGFGYVADLLITELVIMLMLSHLRLPVEDLLRLPLPSIGLLFFMTYSYVVILLFVIRLEKPEPTSEGPHYRDWNYAQYHSGNETSRIFPFWLGSPIPAKSNFVFHYFVIITFLQHLLVYLGVGVLCCICRLIETSIW